LQRNVTLAIKTQLWRLRQLRTSAWRVDETPFYSIDASLREAGVASSTVARRQTEAIEQ
jgi:hypothetical protein